MAESVHPQTGIGPDATEVYALGSSRGESARLQRQADELAADSAALLDRVGLRPGQSAPPWQLTSPPARGWATWRS